MAPACSCAPDGHNRRRSSPLPPSPPRVQIRSHPLPSVLPPKGDASVMRNCADRVPVLLLWQQSPRCPHRRRSFRPVASTPLLRRMHAPSPRLDEVTNLQRVWEAMHMRMTSDDIFSRDARKESIRTTPVPYDATVGRYHSVRRQTTRRPLFPRAVTTRGPRIDRT